ncbi:hypothetical protein ACH4TV_02365 [Streptomyces sp. NPDC020898]|uniref:hypothetical protein n=1 Tax=Streptomyces sp. NPDC020898 TaxID=3365101 RepID=UPI0037B7521F
MAAPAVFLATGRVRRCSTGAPETLVSGTAPATDGDTATEETPAPAVLVPATAAPPEPDPEPAGGAPPATGSAPAETGTVPPADRRRTTGIGIGAAPATAPVSPAGDTEDAAVTGDTPEEATVPKDDGPPPELLTGTTRGPAARATAPGNVTR